MILWEIEFMRLKRRRSGKR